MYISITWATCTHGYTGLIKTVYNRFHDVCVCQLQSKQKTEWCSCGGGEGVGYKFLLSLIVHLIDHAGALVAISDSDLALCTLLHRELNTYM